MATVSLKELKKQSLSDLQKKNNLNPLTYDEKNQEWVDPTNGKRTKAVTGNSGASRSSSAPNSAASAAPSSAKKSSGRVDIDNSVLIDYGNTKNQSNKAAASYIDSNAELEPLIAQGGDAYAFVIADIDNSSKLDNSSKQYLRNYYMQMAGKSEAQPSKAQQFYRKTAPAAQKAQAQTANKPTGTLTQTDSRYAAAAQAGAVNKQNTAQTAYDKAAEVGKINTKNEELKTNRQKAFEELGATENYLEQNKFDFYKDRLDRLEESGQDAQMQNEIRGLYNGGYINENTAVALASHYGFDENGGKLDKTTRDFADRIVDLESSENNNTLTQMFAAFGGGAMDTSALSRQSLGYGKEAEQLKQQLRDMGYTDAQIDSLINNRRDAVNALETLSNQAYVNDLAAEHPALSSAYSILTKPVGDIIAAGDFALNAGSGNYNSNSSAQQMRLANSQIRQSVKEQNVGRAGTVNIPLIGERDVFGTVYDTIMSSADSMYAGMLTPKLGINDAVGDKLASAATDSIGSKVAKYVGREGVKLADHLAGGALISLGAMTDTAADMSAEGVYSNKQIVATSIAAAVFEGMFEAWSLGNLDALDSEKIIVNGLKDYIKSMAIESGVNASEEALTEAANILFDSFANGNESEWSRKVEYYTTVYMAQGMGQDEALSAAKKQVAKEFGSQVAEAGFGGALQGVLMGTGKVAKDTAVKGAVTAADKALSTDTVQKFLKNSQIGSAVTEDEIDYAIEEAKVSGGKAAKQAEKIEKKIAKGKSVSNVAKGKVMQAADEANNKFTEGTYFAGVQSSDALAARYKNYLQSESDGDNGFTDEQISAQYDMLNEHFGEIDSRRRAAAAISVTEENTTAGGTEAAPTQVSKTADGKTFTLVKAGNGEIQAKIDDGETAGLNSVKYVNGLQKVLVRAAASTGNADVANHIIQNYNGSDVNAYVRAYKQAMFYGRTMGYDSVAEVMDNRMSLEEGVTRSAVLSDEALQAAVSDGFATREFASGVTNLRTTRPSALQAFEARVLDTYAKKHNLAYVILDSIDGGTKNGAQIEQTNVIVLATDAESGSLFKVAGHEMFHFVSENAAKSAKVLSAKVFDALAAQGADIDALQKTYVDKGYTTEQAKDEIVGDAMFDVFDEDVVRQLVAEMGTSEAKKIEDKLAKIIGDLRESIKLWSSRHDTPREIYKLTEQVDKMDEIRKLFHEAVAEAGKNFKEGVTSEAAATLEEAGLAIDEKGGAVNLSTKFAFTDPSEREKIAKAMSEQTGRSLEDCRRMIRDNFSITSLVLEDRKNLEYEADDNYSAFKNNSEYSWGAIDFNTCCPKRKGYTDVYDRLQNRFKNLKFNAFELALLRRVCADNGMQVACGLCFVEDRRQLLGSIADEYIGMVKASRDSGTTLTKVKKSKGEIKETPLHITEKIAAEFGEQLGVKQGDDIIITDPYEVTQADLGTYEGFSRLRKEHPQLAMGYIAFNNSRGQQAGRLIEGRAEYKRQILDFTDAQVKRINDNGGLRIFSFSDFEAVHTVDLIQIIEDCAVKGIKIQAYTKQLTFARMVKGTGLKLNRSLIPAGVGYDANGNLIFDKVEGVDPNSADFKATNGDKDIGNIVVGINDKQIRIAMASDMIDFIIPFHTGQNRRILELKGVTRAWKNYKNFQNERDKSTNKNTKHNVNIYTDVIEKYGVSNEAAKERGITAERMFTEAFLQECNERGLIPRFAEDKKGNTLFCDKDENGNYIYTHGYYKFLVDYKLFDSKTGEMFEQNAVVPNFDVEAIKEHILEPQRVAQQKYDSEAYQRDAAVEKFSELVRNGDIARLNKEQTESWRKKAQTQMPSFAGGIKYSTKFETDVASKGDYSTDTDSKTLINDLLAQNDIKSFIPNSLILSDEFIKAIRNHGNFAYPRLYRGMDANEFEFIRKNGYIKSNSSYNFEAQQGQTIFSNDARYAYGYATTFAPTGIRDEFYENGKPSYLVEIANSPDINIKKDLSLGNEEYTYQEVENKYITRVFELRYDRNTDSVKAKDVTAESGIQRDSSEVGTLVHGVPDFYRDKKTGTILYNIQDEDGNGTNKFISEAAPDLIIDFDKIEDAPDYQKTFFSKSGNISGNFGDLEYIEPNNGVKWSTKLDDDYMAAAESGDTETARNDGVRYSNKESILSLDVDWDEDNGSSIKEQILTHLDYINQQNLIYDFTFDKSEHYAVTLDKILKKWGYKVETQRYGTILFDSNAIANIRKYVKTDAEAAAAIASPYVLKRGKVISGHKNHKNKGYPSLTFAGKVSINGEEGIVGVSVLFADKDRVHSLRILTPAGKEFVLIKNNIEAANGGGSIKRVDTPTKSMLSKNDNTTPFPKSQDPSSTKLDSTGSTLSSEQQEYFKDSKVLDEDGNLLVVYHGTDADFTVFDHTKARANMDIQGSFFSPWEIDAGGYGSKVGAYYLNITNPADESTAYKALNRFKGQNEAGRKAREYLISLGYDGVNNGNEEYITFYPEQVKAVDNKNPSTSPDINFSRKLDPVAAENRRLTRENEKLQAANDTLRQQFKLTKGHHISDKALAMMANRLVKRTDSTMNKSELTERLRAIFDYIGNSDELLWEQVDDATTQLAAELISTSDSIDKAWEAEAQPVRDAIKGSRVYISPELKAEIEDTTGSYDRWRRAFMGRIIFTTTDTSAIPLDSWWQEKAERFPGIFTEENPMNQPEALFDIIDMIKPHYINEYNVYGAAEEQVAILAEDIYESYFDLPEVHTYADKAEQKLKLACGEAQTLRAQFKADMIEAKQDMQAQYEQRVQELKDAQMKDVTKQSEKMLRQKAAYEGRISRMREQRNDTENRKKQRTQIIRKVKKLNKLLTQPTDQKHIPQKLVLATRDFLKIFTNDTSVFTQDKLNTLRVAYDSLKGDSNTPEAATYDESLAEVITTLGETINGKRLSQLNATETKAVKQIVDAFYHTVSAENKMFFSDKSDSYRETGEEAYSQVVAQRKKRRFGGNGKIGKIAGKFLVGNMKPEYFFKDLDIPVLYDLYKKIRKGQDTWADTIRNVKQKREELQRRYNYKEWSSSSFEWKVDGRTINLTVEQALSIYATYKREQLSDKELKHITTGGISFEDDDKLAGVIIKPSIEELQNAFSNLTQEQKGYADSMVKYMSTEMSKLGNDVSMAMFGYEKFGEDYYFPISSNRNELFFREGVADDKRLKHMGMTKALTRGASNAIDIGDFTRTCVEHCKQMADYNSFTLPLEDFRRIYNYKVEPGVTLKNEITRVYGAEANKYIETFLRDVNGGARREGTGISEKLLSLSKKGAVMGSASVAIQQPSAIARAFAYVSPKYFIKGAFRNLRTGKVDGKLVNKSYAELMQYAGVAVIKDMGLFDTSVSRGTIDWLMGGSSDTKLQKARNAVDDALGFAPEIMDKITWAHIWEAVKKETQANTDLAGEELLKAAGERFSEVIDLTQVYDSIFSRSQMMRSNNAFDKLATAFMAEPTTTANMLYDAMIQLKNGGKDGVKFAAKAAAAMSVATIFNALLKGLVTAGRDDDDKKTWLEKYIGEVVGGIITEPLTMLPYINTVVNAIQGYDNERMDTQILTDAVNAILMLTNDNKTTGEKVRNIGETLGAVIGIPVKNVLRDIRGANQIYTDIQKYVNGERSTGVGIEQSILQQILIGGKTPFAASDDERIYNDIVNGDEADYERMQDYYERNGKNISTKIRKALKENEPRITEAAVALANSDTATWNSTINELVAEGFEENDVTSAVKSMSNLIQSASTAKSEGDEDTYNKNISDLLKSGYDYDNIIKAVGNTAPRESSGSSTQSRYTATVAEKAIAAGDSGTINNYYEEKLDAKGEKGANSDMRSRVYESYKVGEIDWNTAEGMLRQYGLTDEDELYWKHKELDYTGEGNFSKYYSLYDAIDNGTSVDSSLEELTEHGSEGKSIRSTLTSHYKPILIDMYNTDSDAAMELEDRLVEIYDRLGAKNAQKTINDWFN